VNAEDQKRVIDVIATLGENFRATLSKVGIKGYLMALGDLPVEDIERAGIKALRESTFMPSVKELRELATGIKLADRPQAAWDAFLRYVHLGPYKHVDFDDPLINATLRHLGGWVPFIGRLTNADAEKWARKEFEETYARYLSSGVSGDLCRPLPGLAEAQVVDGKIAPVVPVRVACGLPALAGDIVRPALETRQRLEGLPAVEVKRA
jgi:hypothetical protein